MHSQGRGLLGLAADRQESTPDVQLADSEDLTQRETTTGCEGKRGHVRLHNKVSISPEERPPRRSQMCVQSKVFLRGGWNTAVWKCFTLRE